MMTEEERPMILVISTGGTISMTQDSQTGQSVPTRTANDLLMQTALVHSIEVCTLDLALHTGPELLDEDLVALAHRIQRESQSGVDGIVVTHGTDTLEEVAYFLDEVLVASLPIVVTGAMRPGWAAGYEGIRNLENALHVALIASADYGVLVALNDEIFPAWSVLKTDTGAVGAFAARRGAPVGHIFGDQVEFTWRPVARARVGRIPPSLPTAVPILTMGINDGAVLLDRVSELPVQGIVIAGMGAGSIPPSARKRVCQSAESGMPVVLCSSALSGRTAEEYYYPGAYDDLRAAGVVIEDRLSPRQTRIRLMISLGLGVAYVPFGSEFVLQRRV